MAIYMIVTTPSFVLDPPHFDGSNAIYGRP